MSPSSSPTPDGTPSSMGEDFADAIPHDARVLAQVNGALSDLEPDVAKLLRERFGIDGDTPKNAFTIALEGGATLSDLFDTMDTIDDRSDEALRALMCYGSRQGPSQAVRTSELAQAKAFLVLVTKSFGIETELPSPTPLDLPNSGSQYISTSAMHAEILSLDKDLTRDSKRLLATFHCIVDACEIEIPSIVKMDRIYQVLIQRLIHARDVEGLDGEQAIRNALFQ